jgi:hypothetical protein
MKRTKIAAAGRASIPARAQCLLFMNSVFEDPPLCGGLSLSFAGPAGGNAQPGQSVRAKFCVQPINAYGISP